MTDTTDFAELAQVWRGSTVESWHRGAVAVTNYEGKLVGAWGDAGLLTHPRSALKPFQAMALVESGAADAFGLTEAHIALACGSHHAEPFQVAMVEEWLARLGMLEGALICGPAMPHRSQDQAAAFAQSGARRVYNNCSGKHCGFLTVTRHLNADINYANPANPAQLLYMAALSEYLGLDAATLPVGFDGCGLPTVAVPLRNMATAMARFGLGWSSNATRRNAALRIGRAMVAHPEHISGTDTATARLIHATGGKVIVKGGAEGYLLAAAPERGLGFAIKMADGANRGKFGVLARMLGHYGVIRRAEAEALIGAVEPPLTNSNGAEIGRVEITIEKPMPTTPTLASFAFWLGGVKEAFLPR